MLAAPSDRLEVPVGRFVIDVVRADGELVEVQTGGFGPLGAKLDALLDLHRVRIVHPIAATRRIVRVDEQGEVMSIRRSAKRGSVVEVFDKLTAFPSLLTHPNLTIEVLLLDEDHVRGARPVAVRRRTRDPGERRLRDVLSRIELNGVDDIVCALPPLPTELFSTRELGQLWDAACCSRSARPTAYALSTSSKRPACAGAHPCTGSPPRRTTPGPAFDRRSCVRHGQRAFLGRAPAFADRKDPPLQSASGHSQSVIVTFWRP